jgi:hypothetical protein
VPVDDDERAKLVVPFEYVEPGELVDGGLRDRPRDSRLLCDVVEADRLALRDEECPADRAL